MKPVQKLVALPWNADKFVGLWHKSEVQMVLC